MVRNLLCKVLEIIPNQFVRLAQDRVERLARPPISALVLGSSESTDKHNAQNWVGRVVCLVKQILILHNLRDFLHHAHWLVEVHRHAEAGQVLSNRVLQNLPDARLVRWVLQVRQLLSLLKWRLRHLQARLQHKLVLRARVNLSNRVLDSLLTSGLQLLLLPWLCQQTDLEVVRSVRNHFHVAWPLNYVQARDLRLLPKMQSFVIVVAVAKSTLLERSQLAFKQVVGEVHITIGNFFKKRLRYLDSLLT